MENPASILKGLPVNVNRADELTEFRKRQGFTVGEITPLNEERSGTSCGTSLRKPRLNVQRVKKIKPYRSLRFSRTEEDRYLPRLETRNNPEFYSSDSRDEDRDANDSDRSRSELERSVDYSKERSPGSSKENSSPASVILGPSTSFQGKGRQKDRRHLQKKLQQALFTKSANYSQRVLISESPELKLNAQPVGRKKPMTLRVSETSGSPGSSRHEIFSDDDFQIKTKKKENKNRSAFGRSSDQSEARQPQNQRGGSSFPVSILFGATSVANSRYHGKAAKKSKRIKPGLGSSTKAATSERNKVGRARIHDTPKPRLNVQVVKHKTTTPLSNRRSRFSVPLEDMSS